MSHFRKTPKSEEGLSTIELIISAALGAVIAIGIFTIFANVLQASEITNGQALTTSTAQTVSASLVTTLRNSDQVTVTTLPLVPGEEAARQVVRARTAPPAGSTQWSCTTWVFGATNSRGVETVMQQNTSSSVAIPTNNDWSGWGMLASNVKPDLAGQFVVAPSSSQVNFAFTMKVGSEKALPISNTVLLGAVGTPNVTCS